MRMWVTSVGGEANATPDVMIGHLRKMEMTADIIERIQQNCSCTLSENGIQDGVGEKQKSCLLGRQENLEGREIDIGLEKKPEKPQEQQEVQCLLEDEESKTLNDTEKEEAEEDMMEEKEEEGAKNWCLSKCCCWFK
jgi:hypothetical protein